LAQAILAQPPWMRRRRVPIAGRVNSMVEVVQVPSDSDASAAEERSFLYFLGRQELSDCTVRLPIGSAAALRAYCGGAGAIGAEVGDAAATAAVAAGAHVSAAAAAAAAASAAAAAASAAAVDGGSPDEVRCHRVVLCVGSGYFYRKLVPTGAGSDGDSELVELPVLPDDEELRRQVDVPTLAPLILRYLYSNQQWETIEALVTAENVMGIFVLAELLEIPTLAKKSFEYLDASALDAKSVPRLLHTAVQLRGVPGGPGGNGSAFDAVCQRCCEVLREGLATALEVPGNEALLAGLPVDVLEVLLGHTELRVASEAQVLQLVRRALQDRPRAAPDVAEAAADGAEPEPPAASPPAEEGPPADTSRAAPGAPLNSEEVRRLLGLVRFQHLEHQALLTALQDPVLVQAGAQDLIVAALSTRLGHYEPAATGTAQELTLPPRRAPGVGLSGTGGPGRRRGSQRTAGQDGQAVGGGLGRATNEHGAVVRDSAASAAGQPLFVCSCGGRISLRQRDLRWWAQCSRHPACSNGVCLPGSISAAVVDGHCATCTLQRGADVRTLTVRLAPSHAVGMLAAGTSVLRGLCVAGCSDVLGRLGH